jgi:hypothetical protein
MELEELEQKILKGTKFFKDFYPKRHLETYQSQFLKFCDFVEQYVQARMIKETK